MNFVSWHVAQSSFLLSVKETFFFNIQCLFLNEWLLSDVGHRQMIMAACSYFASKVCFVFEDKKEIIGVCLEPTLWMTLWEIFTWNQVTYLGFLKVPPQQLFLLPLQEDQGHKVYFLSDCVIYQVINRQERIEDLFYTCYQALSNDNRKFVLWDFKIKWHTFPKDNTKTLKNNISECKHYIYKDYLNAMGNTDLLPCQYF